MLLFIVAGETKNLRVADNIVNNYHDWKKRIKHLNGANKLHRSAMKKHFLLLLLLLSFAVHNVIFGTEFKNHNKNGVSYTISAKT